MTQLFWEHPNSRWYISKHSWNAEITWNRRCSCSCVGSYYFIGLPPTISLPEIMPALFTNKAGASTILIHSFLLLVSLPTTSCLRNSFTEGLFSNVLMLPCRHAMRKLFCGHFSFRSAMNTYSVVSDYAAVLLEPRRWQKDDALPMLCPPILHHLLLHHSAIILQQHLPSSHRSLHGVQRPSHGFSIASSLCTASSRRTVSVSK